MSEHVGTNLEANRPIALGMPAGYVDGHRVMIPASTIGSLVRRGKLVRVLSGEGGMAGRMLGECSACAR